MHADRHLGKDDPGARLVHADVILRHLEQRKTLADLRVVELLVGQAVRAGRLQATGHEGAVRRAEVDAPRDLDQPAAGPVLQLGPELVAAMQQRHVVGMLEVAQTDEPRVAVARTHRVGDRKLLQTEHPRPALGQLGAHGRAHRSHAHHDHVVRLSAWSAHPGLRSDSATIDRRSPSS
jgi:hypothetical protein